MTTARGPLDLPPRGSTPGPPTSAPPAGAEEPREAAFDVRLFRIGQHIFRVRMDHVDSPAEVYRDGRWEPVVLTTEEVTGLMNAQELSPEETEAFLAAEQRNRARADRKAGLSGPSGFRLRRRSEQR